ncbi:uncharacterized protein LOC121862936 [Homarus americanus]|uniref:uncharacterized protein LOC121862936 n=1 Tax=Homarus americanus TaxID=6706 RepID=UPI001C4621E1|nr:uncharacterized protein LOC121862936 [Homarus americanus]
MATTLLLLLLFALTMGQQCIHPYAAIGGRCIYIDPFILGSMQEVRNVCQSHHGDILWFEEGTDCDFYRDLLNHLHTNQLNEKDYWMGVTDTGHELSWQYMKTGKAARLGVPYWLEKYPHKDTTSNCAILYKNGGYYWIDAKCDTRKAAAICRYA